MTTKEKVIRESIARIKKETKKINDILDATPISDIITLRGKFSNIASGEKWRDPKVMEKVEELAAEEKRLFALADLQKDSIKLLKRKSELDIELSDLGSELYIVQMRQGKIV